MKQAAFVISIIALTLSVANITISILKILEKKKYFSIE